MLTEEFTFFEIEKLNTNLNLPHPFIFTTSASEMLASVHIKLRKVLDKFRQISIPSILKDIVFSLCFSDMEDSAAVRAVVANVLYRGS